MNNEQAFIAAMRAFAAQDSQCLECGEAAQERHHVIPRSLGGTATVALCSKCHGRAHGFARGNVRELTMLGLQRVKASGKTLGRPPKLTQAQITRLRDDAPRKSVSAQAREFDVSRATVLKYREAA